MIDTKSWPLILAAILGCFYLIEGSLPPTSNHKLTGESAETARLDIANTEQVETELMVLHIGERSWENHPAIAIVFSEALDDASAIAEHIELRDQSNKLLAVQPVIDETGRTVFLPQVQADRSYKLLVTEGLMNTRGARLNTKVQKSIKIRKVTPAFGFASRGVLLPADLSAGLPIMTVNIPEIDVQILRIHDDKLGEFLGRYYGGAAYGRYRRVAINSDWGLNQLQDLSDSVFMARFKTTAEADTRSVSHLPINQYPELKRSGLYVAVLKKPGEFYGNLRSTLFYVSDIGLHVRGYGEQLHIYANSIATAEAIPGVEIRVIDKDGRFKLPVKTDNQGIVRINLNSARTIVARKAEQISVVSLNEPELDLSSFAVSGPPHKAMELFLYSSRDLFRPGERMDVVGLLRDHDGRLSVQLPLHASLVRPDGKVQRSWILHPEGGGNYADTFGLPVHAVTGKWQLLVHTTPDADQPVGKLEFNVEEFLPERMQLEMRSQQEFLQAGEALQIQLTGSYLHGAVAAGNTVKTSVSVSQNTKPFSEYPDFEFGDTSALSEQRHELDTLTLNHAGRAQLSYQPGTDPQAQAQTIRVVSSLFENGGRPVVRELERTVWMRDELIGIRPLWTGDHAPTNQNVALEIIRLATDGSRLAASNLSVSVIHKPRDYYWEWSNARGWHARFSADEFPIHNQNMSFSAKRSGQISVPVTYGTYRIEIFDPATGHSMNYSFEAGWQHLQDRSQLASRPDKIPLRLDRASYHNGEIATLTASVPDDSQLLVFVEADRVLWTKRLSVQAGDVSVEIPVDKDWDRHDIYISALTLRPGRQADGFSPKRALGVIHLPLDRDGRALNVSIQTPARAVPETTLQTRIKVAGSGVRDSGQLRLTLSAVDVGALAITSYRTPDPVKHFFGRRRFNPTTHDLYSKVIEQFEGMQASMRFGGDAAMGRRRLGESRVEIVSMFSGIVDVDDQGYASVPLALPDFNGRLRLMAVAFDDHRYGSAHTEVTVSAPLVAQIALPRFLAPGDESRITIDLHNQTKKPLSFRMHLGATSPLQLGYEPQDYRLDPGEHIVVQTPVFARFNPGIGHIRLTTTGDVTVNRRRALSVRPAWPETRRAYHAQLDPGESFTLPADSAADLITESVRSNIHVSGEPPIDIAGAVTGLLAYPYGCLEQTTSKAFPYLLVDSATAARFELPEFDHWERSERIQQAIERLKSLQKTSGGFALWSGNGKEQLWLSAYVTDFLVSAADAGYEVPTDMLKPALKRMQVLLAEGIRSNDPFTRGIRHSTFSARAYAGYVLARRSSASLGSLRELYKGNGKQALSGLALIQLGIALHLAGDPQLAETAIREGLHVGTQPSQWLGDYGSAVRDTALAYALLNQHRIMRSEAAKLLHILHGELRGRSWLSTQERTAVFRAGLQFSSTSPEWVAQLVAGESSRIARADGPQSIPVTTANIESGFEISNLGGTPLFLRAQVSGYTKIAQKLKHPAITVKRRWLDMDGRPIVSNTLKQGRLILVEIHVAASMDIRDAMLVDLVPAGLEVENLNIGMSEGLPDIRVHGVNPRVAMNDAAILNREYRDDRFVAALSLRKNQSRSLFYLARVVSPGTFSVPPSFAEDMYRAEIRTLGEGSADIRIQ